LDGGYSTTIATQIPVDTVQQIEMKILTADAIKLLYSRGEIYRYQVLIEARFVELQSDIEKTIPLYLEIEVGDIYTEENDACSPSP
jgi:hypothetical protein